MHFSKMQGAGNDFVIIENMDGAIPESDYGELAIKLCQRRMSIGADGMIIVLPPEDGGDYRMLFYNSDGTLGEMCGNGARCIARYGYDRGLAGEIQRIETTAGIVIGQRIDKSRFRVRLNDPSGIRENISVAALGCHYSCTFMELGDPGIPHCLVRLDRWDEMSREKLFRLGKELRSSPLFPKGANVTFRTPADNRHWKCITFERGVEDFTLACGTGAGSTACAMLLRKETEHFPVMLDFPGGTLEIEISHTGKVIRDLFLTGPTQVVAVGEYFGE